MSAARRALHRQGRGFFGIGVWHTKFEVNIGTLMRSAHAFGANFVYTIGRRYEIKASDVSNATRHIPCYHYGDITDLVDHLPLGCPLIGIELTDRAKPLAKYIHPAKACYLLGAEDHGLSEASLNACHRVIYIAGGAYCLNVASAGTVVMYDRMVKGVVGA